MRSASGRLCLACVAAGTLFACKTPPPVVNDHAREQHRQLDPQNETPTRFDTSAISTAPTESNAEEEAARKALDANPRQSTSVRNPNDGSLTGGIALPMRTPGIKFNPNKNPNARYGTVEVVQALVRAGQVVHAEHGGLPATINDLSLETGGPLSGHKSHQSGRDVDVLFYQLDAGGTPVEPVGAFFDERGRGVDFKALDDPADDAPRILDVTRTWRFVQAIIENETALMQRIYVAEHLRALLLEEAKRQRAPASTVQRFSELSCQPGYPHDDHFHFRFFCTTQDIKRGCRDSEPIYPWRRAQLNAVNTKPRPLARKRPSARAKTTTHAEARTQAGPMHKEVVRWLDRRKAWLDKPNTGRPYCR